MKLAINTCFGGFSLSEDAYNELGLPWDGFGFKYSHEGIKTRSDPKLIACIEKLGPKANGRVAELKIVEVPDDLILEITEDDGFETIEECHRSWR